MTAYIIGAGVLLGLVGYVYKSYSDYNAENAALAEPLAAQIPLFLEHFQVEERFIKERISRTNVYDDFAVMYTFKSNGVVWDFNIVNKKIATDPNKCIRLHIAFHCKNIKQQAFALTPKEGLSPEGLEQFKPVDADLGEAMDSTFVVEGNDEKGLEQFLDESVRQRLLDIYSHNKGSWRLQKNTLSYKEPIEIDTEEKRLLVYKIIELGFKLAKKVDA